ncbi:MAG: NADH-quinone oxidoreductase subunit C [Alphaproteobacteria bacterium]
MSDTGAGNEAALKEFGAALVSGAGPSILAHEVAFGELTLIAKAEDIVGLLTYLRDDSKCQFTTLVDICGVDYPAREKRFEVVYHLLSMKKNHRLRIKVLADEKTAVPSAVSVYPAANWFEREAFDMYGIVFSGHPDLRRLLTDYGFVGYPLRKDFPLTGHVEVRYDPEQKRVVYEPVTLRQEFRNFDFLSPWEGMDDAIRREDEKKASGNG